MKIINTQDAEFTPSVLMMVYGEGGVGKSTFASTAPNPLFLDFENGSKFFGSRGISVDVVQINKWKDIEDPELIKAIRESEYQTIVLDPIGEAMDKLIDSVKTHPDSKMRQRDGSPTMAGWGYVKKRFKNFLKFLRDESGKHVLLIAHIDEKSDEERMIKRPLIATKISADIVNMVDIVGYMTTKLVDGDEQRAIIVDPTNDKYTAKDRTGQLPREIAPDFQTIVTMLEGLQKTEDKKEKKEEKKPAKKAPAKKKAEAKAEDTTEEQSDAKSKAEEALKEATS